MTNLYWKKPDGSLITLASASFGTEEELEDYLYENPDLLGELVIISRQTRSTSRRDIPDLIAVDADNNIVIIELKRGPASEEVIPQVMRYAVWAETNPDSIKNLWLECEDKPDDMEMNWEAINIKIMIVAASFPPSVLRLVNRIAYEIDLVEITRFTGEGNEFLLLNPRQPDTIARSAVATGTRNWDEAWYRENYNPKSVDNFMRTVKRLEKLVAEHEWRLETKFNKGYVSFKYGFPIVFGVNWIGSKSFCLFFKVPRDTAESIRIEGLEPLRYEDEWKQVLYKVEGEDYPVEKLMPLFEAAYRNITGQEP